MGQFSSYTSTAFGYVIAVILPGAAALYALTFYSSPVDDLFDRFLDKDVGVGLLFVLILISITLSVLMAPIRWLLFEKLIAERICWPPLKFDPNDFKQFGNDPDSFAAFRAIVDEHYRYHQFFGSMVLVLPPLFIGIDIDRWQATNGRHEVVIGLEVLLIWITSVAAFDAYRKFIQRGGAILRGDS
ncbi:MAG: hypothetical protein WEA81_07545 [Dehalococcoidia bacterium]